MMEVIIKCSDDCRGNKKINREPIEEVVRCGECKYFNENSWESVNGTPLIVAHAICQFWGNGCKTNPQAFCSFGERKDD